MTVQPPVIKQVLKMLVARVDADGNAARRMTAGLSATRRLEPSWKGWNITAAGFYKDKICSFTGGMVPFAKTRTERMVSGDPRLSLEERYSDESRDQAGT